MEISHDQLLRAYNALPATVREYLASGELGPLMRRLGTKHQLHVDTIGSLDEAVGLMLTGLMDPNQLMQEMNNLGIVNPKASLIAKDLNDAVFKPLHDRMRAESGKRVPANPPLAGVPAPLGTTPTAPPRAVAAATPPAPRPAPPPRPEPIIPPAPFVPTPPRETRAPVMPNAATQPPAPIPKNYARDPYREPIDENPQQ